jgi:hypothetical protein
MATRRRLADDSRRCVDDSRRRVNKIRQHVVNSCRRVDDASQQRHGTVNHVFTTFFQLFFYLQRTIDSG